MESTKPLDELLTPLERNIKTYLAGAVASDLIEVIAKLALVRPEDPHRFLAEQLLAKSPAAARLRIVETPATASSTGGAGTAASGRR